MGTLLKITKLEFRSIFTWQIINCAAVLLLHILISVAVIRLANTTGPAGVGDGIALVWMPIMGLVFFSPSFKYTLSLGISRKTFFWAGIVSMAMMAAVVAVIVAIIYVINLKVANVWMIYELVYRQQGLLGLIVWEFAALLFLGVLGWFIRLVYYVSNRITRLIVSIAPFVLAALLILFNALANGGITRAIWEFLKTVMGLSGANPNPFIGMTSLLAASVILGLFVFMLLRRAQMND